MSMILDELAGFIASEGHGVVNSTIFKSALSDSPDAQIAIIESAGIPTQHAFSDAGGVVVDTPSVQVLARGVPHDYVTARALIGDVYESLDTHVGGLISGVKYHLFEVQPPWPLRVDEKGRQIFVMNVVAYRGRA